MSNTIPFHPVYATLTSWGKSAKQHNPISDPNYRIALASYSEKLLLEISMAKLGIIVRDYRADEQLRNCGAIKRLSLMVAKIYADLELRVFSSKPKDGFISFSDINQNLRSNPMFRHAVVLLNASGLIECPELFYLDKEPSTVRVTDKGSKYLSDQKLMP